MPANNWGGLGTAGSHLRIETKCQLLLVNPMRTGRFSKLPTPEAAAVKPRPCRTARARWTPTAPSSSPCTSSHCSEFEGTALPWLQQSLTGMCTAHSPGRHTCCLQRPPPLLRAAAQCELRPHRRRRRTFATQLPLSPTRATCCWEAPTYPRHSQDHPNAPGLAQYRPHVAVARTAAALCTPTTTTAGCRALFVHCLMHP